MLKQSKYFVITFLISGTLALIIKALRTSPNIVFQNNVLSFLLNSLPSFLATTGFCMLPLIFVNKHQIKTMGFVSLGLLVYEIEQNWTSRTFDTYDIIAIILGYAVSILVFKISKKHQAKD